MQLSKNYWKLWSATAISSLGSGVSAIAYPWLASTLTRSPLLISIVGLAGTLPWLLFTLPSGVITDRFPRRKIIVSMDFLRGMITLVFAFLIFTFRNSFTDVKHPGHSTTALNISLLVSLIVASFLMGSATVLGDNASQTFMPEIVEDENLQKANGQMWTAQNLTEQFMGPPLASVLLGLSIYLPFFFDAASFFFSAALISLIVVQIQKSSEPRPARASFMTELKEGFSWLWSHKLIKRLAIVLGSLNFISSAMFASFILFAQEVLNTNVFVFSILGTSGALGGALGGVLGPRITKKLKNGPTLTLALIGMPSIALLIGFSTNWYEVWILMFFETMFAVLWNIVTVSFRQSVIPSHLLGRVNSGYRFFGWGSMPLGALFGGALVTISQQFISREWALRTPYFVGAALGYLIYLFTRGSFTSEEFEKAAAEKG